MSLRRIYEYYRTPGIFVHEVAHLIAVEMMPRIQPTEINLKSHISYKGKLTSISSFVISYMPLLVNTLVSFILFALAFSYGVSRVISVLVFILGISICMESIPSYRDSVNPIRLLRERLFTYRFPLVVILGPVFATITAPFIVLSYLMKRIPYVGILIPLLYTLFIVYIATSVDLSAPLPADLPKNFDIIFNLGSSKGERFLFL